MLELLFHQKEQIDNNQAEYLKVIISFNLSMVLCQRNSNIFDCIIILSFLILLDISLYELICKNSMLFYDL